MTVAATTHAPGHEEDRFPVRSGTGRRRRTRRCARRPTRCCSRSSSPSPPRSWAPTARTSACTISRASSARRSRCSRRSARARSTIEIGTAVIDMRYENPLYMAEDAGAADLIAGGRLQLGISRGSPEQVIDGWRHFGYAPRGGRDRRRHGAPSRRGVPRGARRARASRKPNPRPMFPNPPGLLRVEPHSEGLRERIWWGSSSNATAEWAATARHEPPELDAEGRRERRAAARPAAQADRGVPRGVEGGRAHSASRACR